jgi:hypothetical protein
MNNDEIYEKEFLKPIIYWGSRTCLLAVLISFAPALYIYFAYGVIPKASEILQAFILVAPYAVVLQIVEPPSYFPILGVPGTYMSFLAGNISNVRVPCSAIAQNAAGVVEGSKEGSIISTIAIGISVIVNLIILGIGVFVGAQLLAVVNEALKYILPSVFGGVFGSFAMRDIKLAIISLIVCVILVATNIIPTTLIAPIGVVVTIYVGIKLTNKKMEA